MFGCSGVRMFACPVVLLGRLAELLRTLNLFSGCLQFALTCKKPENKNDGKSHVTVAKGLNNYGGSRSYPYSLLLWLHCTD